MFLKKILCFKIALIGISFYNYKHASLWGKKMVYLRQILASSSLISLIFFINLGIGKLISPVIFSNINNPLSSSASRLYIPYTAKSSVNYYYIDSQNGSDTNLGTSESQPWRTLKPVHAMKFFPGSVIHFKRGSSWTDGLIIDDSGVAGNPITFTTYGEGEKPIFRNPGDSSHWTYAIKISGSWNILEGALVKDAYVAGVRIEPGAHHNIIRDIEATNVGIGISIRGQYNLATHNHIHDLNMVVNTPGGIDDFGAVGVSILDSNNEISYNKMENCKAVSYDFGYDGGATEIYGNVNNTTIHHNISIGSRGFIEVGGGSAIDDVVAYNVIINSERPVGIHLGGNFASVVNNFHFDNNTIVDTRNERMWSAIVFTDGSPTPDTFIMRNNIFYVNNYQWIASAATFTHQNNLYKLMSQSTELGFDPSPDEILADPLFVNLAASDYHLQSTSPAIDMGLVLGYPLDFENKPIPVGLAPDFGAFEYHPTP